MASHAQHPTSKDTSYGVGETAIGDVIFVDFPCGTRKTLLFVCDLQSRCLTGVELGSRSPDDLKSGYISVKDTYKQNLKVFKFDRVLSCVSYSVHSIDWMHPNSICSGAKARPHRGHDQNSQGYSKRN